MARHARPTATQEPAAAGRTSSGVCSTASRGLPSPRGEHQDDDGVKPVRIQEDVGFNGFLAALSSWLDRRLGDMPEVKEDTWEAIPIPRHQGRVSDSVLSHIAHTAGNCQHLAEKLTRLTDGPALRDDDLDSLVFSIGPFSGGDMCEIKYMAYEFGPLYHNVMNQILIYLNEDEFRQARENALLWSNDWPAAGESAPPVPILAERLGAIGRLSDIELSALAERLVDVWRASSDYLALAKGCTAYMGAVWWGLVAFQASHMRLLTRIVRLEPLWSVYEHSRYA